VAIFQPLHLSLPFSPNPLSWLVGVACASVLGVQAQTQPVAPAFQVAAVALKEVVISGTRNEQSVDELPMAIDVINAKDIEEQQLQDIRDIARGIPNVSVRRAPTRFSLAGAATGREGNAGFNIRGLDGNRVLMLVDGIRAPRFYGFGSNAFGRDTLSIDLVKRVELIKGPASALYGSDGIAGLVNFITYEPSDFLKDGKTLGGKAAFSYSGDDNTKSVSATVAGRASEVVSWQISAATSAGNALANRGENDSFDATRTAPNPQKDTGQAALAKLVLQPTASQKHVITFEYVDKKSDYELLTARATLPLANIVTVPAAPAAARNAAIAANTAVANAALNVNALTTMSRNRLTWDARYKLDALVADNLQTVLSLQNTNSREYVFEDRNTSPERVRDTTYQERTLQASAQADKTIRMSADWRGTCRIKNQQTPKLA
jgi:hemoglobin/transferrin/lactoferrin receptor protein